MIEYHSETNFELIGERHYSEWIKKVVSHEGKEVNQLSFVFCSDEFLLELNKKFLDHDTLTDILTFPWSEEGPLEAEIYISIPRVRENAQIERVEFEKELQRVMIHGVLHMLGYDDETKEQKARMRSKEDNYIKMFHVEQKGDV